MNALAPLPDPCPHTSGSGDLMTLAKQNLAKTLLFSVLVLLIGFAHAVQAQTAIRSDFDHDSTGFRLDGAHLVAQCGACHSRGIFEGTLRLCADCHEDGGTVVATAKPARHILSTQQCESCHATRSFLPLRRMDHIETVGDCVSCHDNQLAPGKPVDHPPASDQCDSCHLTVAFSPVRTFDHSGIVANCFSCHDGITAAGKPTGHLQTTNICEDCHRTDTFSLVVNFEHLQALGVCSSCHNGMLATGQGAGHVPTTAECDSCHNTTGWQ